MQQAVKPLVLLTDGNERATLAAARSLRAAGARVWVCAASRVSLAGSARGVLARRVQADPLRDAAGFAAGIASLAREAGQGGPCVLIPMTDASVEAVLAHRDMLPQGVVIPMPDLARFRAASDKQGILALAHQADFGVPKTVVLESAASSIGARDISFPAVLKPHRSVVGSGEATRKVAVVPVADAAAARAALSAFPAAAFPILLQEEIRGVGEGVFALRWNGRMIAVFAHRRLREKPPSGGVSVYRESIAPAPDLIEPATRLLERLQWQGVAMIECKRDESSGRPVVMEINGRFWGSLQLAIDAGVDFPMLLVRCAIGESVSPRSAGYAVGVRSRWFWGDVDHLYLQLKRPVGVSRLGAVAAFLRPHLGRNERTEVWRWNDPVPFLVESLRWLGVLR